MRLTIEGRGHTFVLALERDEPDVPEPDLTPGDVFAETERRPSLDYDDRTPIGFAMSKGNKR